MDEQKNLGISANEDEGLAYAKELLCHSGLPNRNYNMKFDTFNIDDDNREAFDLAQKYAAGYDEYRKRGVGLYIYGNYGSGKTHLASAITIDLLRRGVPVIFESEREILSSVKLAYGSNESEYDAMKIYLAADLLVIDDFGKSRATAWSLDVLYWIISSRHEDMLPTIITTNHSEKSLTKQFSVNDHCGHIIGAMASRLRECCEFVKLEAKDRRRDKTDNTI
jgi:DNA replication protein DnaC